MTGASDGTLAVWSQTKKRPTSVLRKAHGYPRPGIAPVNAEPAGSVDGSGESMGLERDEPVCPGSIGGDAASWIGAVGVCKGTDLVVSAMYTVWQYMHVLRPVGIAPLQLQQLVLGPGHSEVSSRLLYIEVLKQVGSARVLAVHQEVSCMTSIQS